MRNSLFCPAVAGALLVGCGPQENPDQLKEVNQSLERANRVIEEDCRLIDLQWEMHLKDPQVATIAQGLLHRMNRIKVHADSIRAVITALKNELVKQSKDLKIDYVPAARQLYDVNGAGYQLFTVLATFKDSIPAILGASEYVKRLTDTIPLLRGYKDTLLPDQRTKYAKKWLDKNFGRNSSLMAMIMLNKIENDVLTTEKVLLDYCNSNVAIDHIQYDRYSVVAVLTSSYVKKGQPVQVTAGVGEFSKSINPKITVDNTEVKLYDDGTAVHSFTADGKPGEHSVLVKVEFTKRDGSKTITTKRLVYEIADEK